MESSSSLAGAFPPSPMHADPVMAVIGGGRRGVELRGLLFADLASLLPPGFSGFSPFRGSRRRIEMNHSGLVSRREGRRWKERYEKGFFSPPLSSPLLRLATGTGFLPILGRSVCRGGAGCARAILTA